VLPSNSSVTTVIVPPCTQGPGGTSNKSNALPANNGEKIVTAPPCTVPSSSSSSSSGS
jgi:hypothetical protein